MLLGIQPEVWTCTQDQMADYTTPQGSEQKPKCVRPSSQACSSPMTQQLPHTLNKIYSVLWTDSLRPAISPKRTNVLGQDVNTLTVITINNYKLEVVHQFTYHGSTISDNLSAETPKSTNTSARSKQPHSRLGEPQADHSNEDGSAQRLYSWHPPVRM